MFWLTVLFVLMLCIMIAMIAIVYNDYLLSFPCEHYRDMAVRNLPARCLEYFR